MNRPKPPDVVRRREALAEVLRGSHVTLTAAAKALGWPRQKVQDYCSKGEPLNIPAVSFVRLALVAGVRVEELLDRLLKA